jgi:conjugative transfer signal peptidase TraF
MQDKERQTIRMKYSNEKAFRVSAAEILASRVRQAFEAAAASFGRLVVLATTALVACVVAVPSAVPLRLNLSKSEPRGLYRVASSISVHRGSLVSLCVDRELIAEGVERRYIGRGSCPNGLEPVLKKVVGEEGDVVETTEGSVAVNGKELKASRTSLVDSSGRTLEHFPWGAHRLSQGELWVFSTRDRSWDSRYFGPRRMEEVEAVVEPLLTFD